MKFSKDKPKFEILGYHVDYYDVENNKAKYIGSIKLDQPDRPVMGFEGRRIDDVTELLELRTSNGKIQKIINKKVMTECVPICGRMLDIKIEI